MWRFLKSLFQAMRVFKPLSFSNVYPQFTAFVIIFQGNTMSTVQYIYDRAATLPEEQQREALDFIEFLAAKYAAERTESVQNLSALYIMRLPREERTIIMAEQGKLMRRHYAENPDEILPDVLDDIFEETP